MADGNGCTCGAYGECECGCGADWTPQELIDARAEIARLRLTDVERRAIELAIESESTPDVHYLTPAAPSVRDTLRGLLERLK